MSHLRYYLVSINLNYLYNFGFLLGVSIFMQTISGLFLTLIYYTQLELYSNIYIMTYDYYYGYLYRNIHILLATIINILLLIHMFKGLLYNNLSSQLYIHYSGYILYLLLIIISYLGYILTYGQLSYWGATVIINLLPVSLATLILGNYNISSITINRYLILHIILTLVLYVFIIIHIFYLHQLSSQSPLPISILQTPASQLNITFHHFILKDVTSLLFLLLIFVSIALFILLNLSHSNNLIPINPLSTPQHIIPEWYFLYLYSILKIIPSKLGGILTVVITILILLLLTTSNYSYNLYNHNNISISNYNNIDMVLTIVFSYIYLAYIGLQLPIAPYLYNLRLLLLYLPVPAIILTLMSQLPNISQASLQHPLSSYVGIMSTTNHKRIGLYYLLTGAYIAILGIILSIFIRIELYSPSSTIINISNISFYNYTISNHGLLMLLFIVMPILFGAYGNYLLVLSVGLIDIVFPRINNFGYLLLVLSYLLIQYSIFTEYLTGSGWTLYPPLSTITSTYIISIMFIALSISGVSSLLTSVNYLLLIPYLLHISDLLLISYLITALMVLYTIPVLAGAFLLATSDILLSTSFFTSYSDPVLFQHLFWFFGQSSIWPVYTVKYIMNDAICWDLIRYVLLLAIPPSLAAGRLPYWSYAPILRVPCITIYHTIRLLLPTPSLAPCLLLLPSAGVAILHCPSFASSSLSHPRGGWVCSCLTLDIPAMHSGLALQAKGMALRASTLPGVSASGAHGVVPLLCWGIQVAGMVTTIVMMSNQQVTNSLSSLDPVGTSETLRIVSYLLTWFPSTSPYAKLRLANLGPFSSAEALCAPGGSFPEGGPSAFG